MNGELAYTTMNIARKRKGRTATQILGRSVCTAIVLSFAAARGGAAQANGPQMKPLKLDDIRVWLQRYGATVTLQKIKDGVQPIDCGSNPDNVNSLVVSDPPPGFYRTLKSKCDPRLLRNRPSYDVPSRAIRADVDAITTQFGEPEPDFDAINKALGDADRVFASLSVAARADTSLAQLKSRLEAQRALARKQCGALKRVARKRGDPIPNCGG